MKYLGGLNGISRVSQKWKKETEEGMIVRYQDLSRGNLAPKVCFFPALREALRILHKHKHSIIGALGKKLDEVFHGRGKRQNISSEILVE